MKTRKPVKAIVVPNSSSLGLISAPTIIAKKDRIKMKPSAYIKTVFIYLAY